MFTRLLIPLDGSKTAESVLPYAHFLAANLKTSVELLSVVDVAEIASHIPADRARHLDTLVQEGMRHSEAYLKAVADTFAGTNVKRTVENGRAEDVIVERAGVDNGTLITMATHGRSGLNRWLLGSIAEKVLRGTANPLLLVRAREETLNQDQAAIKSVAVPLDGSEVAESVLPTVIEVAKRLNLEITLFRAYNIPYYSYSGGDAYAINLDELLAQAKDEVSEYLDKKASEVKECGIEKVSYVIREGFTADEIISFAETRPATLIAMCTHGRSGVKRWVLGSITETVVRHSADPILVVRSPA
jgi:nucleotide-binding universal stress UspA family protein